LTESLTLFFLTMAVFLAVKYRTNPRRFFLLLLGTSLGLLVLQRPTFMLIPLLFLGYVLLSPKIRKKDIIPAALLVVLPLTAVLAPWSLYAKSETGSWSLVRTGVGFNLMQGIVRSSPSLLDNFFEDFRHFQAGDFDKNEMTGKIDALLHSKEDMPTQGGYFSPDVARLIDFALATYVATWHAQPPDTDQVIECDLFLKKAASSWIRHYPFSFLRIVSANLSTLLFGDFQPLVYQQMGGDLYLYTAVIERVLWLLFAVSTLVLLLRRQFNITFFPLAIVLYLIIVHWPMHTEPRYFIYAYTFMPLAIPALLPGRPPRNIPCFGGEERNA
jgi:4-amino-4-deoxy-L-arabinose transferase-like glycosyltransferase